MLNIYVKYINYHINKLYDRKENNSFEATHSFPKASQMFPLCNLFIPHYTREWSLRRNASAHLLNTERSQKSSLCKRQLLCAQRVSPAMGHASVVRCMRPQGDRDVQTLLSLPTQHPCLFRTLEVKLWFSDVSG